MFPAGTTAKAAGGGVFAPTQFGRFAGDGNVVLCIADDFGIGSSDASSDFLVWIETSATDCFIYIEGDANGNVAAVIDWFDSGGGNQGAPGADRLVYQLNERPDSVNIFTSALDDTDTGINQQALPGGGAFTDDDKTTFFNPVDTTEYGWKLDGFADDPGVSIANGDMTVQFTFRKAGYADLTVSFKGALFNEAEDGS